MLLEKGDQTESSQLSEGKSGGGQGSQRWWA
jgi:hypothetical protein